MDRAGGYLEYEFVADLYDHIGPYQNRPDINFFVEAAHKSGGPVLEIGCGTGRVLVPTAREGIEIVGLDLSPHMLQICRSRLDHEAPEVKARAKLVEADMRDFDLGRRFKLITTPFRPFQHLTTVEDQIACLRSIHRHLEPKGLLILEIFNPSLKSLTRDNLGDEWGDESEFVTPDGRRFHRKTKILDRDLFNQINKIELVYYVTHPDGRTERLVHAFPMRYLYRFEADHLLARCGFEVEAVYSDFEKSPYGSNYPGN